ncbi:hypothetical protein SLE2022_218650 [Rubroshorea leprosula]
MTDTAGERKDEKKVMVAIDESEHSYHALMWVLDNLKDSLKSPLIIFMAQPATSDNYTFQASLSNARIYCPFSTTELVNSVKNHHQKLTLAFLEKAKDICASRGVVAEMITEIGDPKVTICSVAEKLNVNLLVVGEHELGRIKRAVAWSVSNYCFKYAKCPVLIVKKPQ